MTQNTPITRETEQERPCPDALPFLQKHPTEGGLHGMA